MNHNQTFTQKVIDGLHKAVTELEEFQVQMALGKAEARDLYNEQKKQLSDYIHSVKNSLNHSADTLRDESSEVNALLAEIMVHLSNMKTETKEAFDEQKKHLQKLFSDFENYVKANKSLDHLYTELLWEIEVFKLKLEILNYRYEQKKNIVKDEFEKNKTLFFEKINGIKTKIQDHTKDNPEWNNFQKEMTEAYHHLKKAFLH